MKAITHWLKALFRWVSLMLMFPLLIVALLLTPLGLKIGMLVLTQFVPDLHYKQVSGTVLGPLTFKEISYRHQDQQFSANHLYLQWRPADLLIGKFYIDTLNVDNLVINIPRAPSPDVTPSNLQQSLRNIRGQLSKITLPFNLQIDQLKARNIVWQQHPGEPSLHASEVQGKAILESNQVNINLKAHLIRPYSIQTELHVQGRPEQYHFELKAFNPQTRWLISGEAKPDTLILDTEKARIFGGELSVHLIWSWQDPMSWQLSLNAKQLDFSLFQPNWPSPIDINLKSSGALGAKIPRFNWDATIKTPQSQIITQGKHDQQWDLNWNIQIKQLAELLPFSSGVVTSTGELHGQLNKPHTQGHLQASLLRWQQFRADKLTADWNIDATENTDSAIQAIGEQVFTPWAEIQKLQFAGKGKWAKHELTGHIQAYNADLQLTLLGGMSGSHWQGAIQNLKVSDPKTGTWSLVSPGALYASMQRIEITALCLESTNKSQLCLRANWNENDNTWQVASTSRLNLQQISDYIPEKYSINLPLEFHLTAEGTGDVVKQLQITGEAASGSFTYRGQQVIHTEIQGTQLTTRMDSRGATINFHTTFGGNNIIKAELFLPKASSVNLFDKNQPLEGKINISVNNFDIIQSILPDLIGPQDKLKANFVIGGSIGQPIVKGSANLEGSDVKIPGLNIQLSQINLALNTSGRELNYILNATSGGQPLRVTGKTSLYPPDFSTDLNLTGTEVLFADTPVYTIYVSPNIHLHIKKHDIDLTGTVSIPKGMLHKLNFQHETTLPEDEVVFIGERPIAKESSWNTHIQLTVNLGSDVKVDSPGLKGNLSGSLIITSSPGQALIGNGRIDINNGIYEVYGRELTIAPASGIVFRSSLLSNPFLNIQAFTRILVTDAVSQQQLGTNEITVGMNIAGTSASPQVTLFSSAGNLSQADILSFLLLGTSSSGISPTNMNLLLQALNNLPLTKKGAGSVQGLTNQVKQGLGLSELGVESEATFGPSGEALPTAVPTSYFVVGKRLTSRIYFRYKYDPFNSTNLFQLNYLFSTNWSLQLETDGASQSGIDILYSIQTGAPTSADKTPATSH